MCRLSGVLMFGVFSSVLICVFDNVDGNWVVCFVDVICSVGLVFV